MKPIISVIVPIYNVENYLAACLESILAQTFSDFELILVDDGSPDSCGEICEYYSKIDCRVKVIHKKNGGVSSARNKGINMAIGSYIAFVDPDDTIESNMYELLYENALNLQADLVVCPIKTINLIHNTNNISSIWGSSNCILDQKEIKEYIIPSILNNKSYSLVSSVNKLYRKALFNHIRFEEYKHHSEDARLNFNLLPLINKLVYVEQPLYNYYIRNRDSLTQVFRKNLYEYIYDNKTLLIDICNKYNLEIYKKRVKHHYSSVTLSYMNEVVNSPLTVNEKRRILSSILTDEEFYKDILIYSSPSLYYRALKFICILKNVDTLYIFVLAKKKLQTLVNNMSG